MLSVSLSVSGWCSIIFSAREIISCVPRIKEAFLLRSFYSVMLVEWFSAAI